MHISFLTSAIPWNILAVLLLLSCILSPPLVDIFFVLGVCAIILNELAHDKGRGIRSCIKVFGVSNYFLWLWFIANILGYFINTTMGSEQWEEVWGLRWIVSPYIAVYIGQRVSFSSRDVKGILYASLGLFVIQAILFYSQNAFSMRYEGIYGNANLAAFILVIFWSFALGVLSDAKWGMNSHRWVQLLLCSFLGLLLFFTQSRGTWVAMLAVLGAIIFLRYSRRKLSVLFSIFLVGLLMVLTNLNGINERLKYSLNWQPGSSQGLRAGLWKAYWEIFKDHPIVGVGLFEPYRVLPSYYEKHNIINPGIDGEQFVSHAHNQILHILATSGLLGVTGCIGFFVLSGLWLYKRSQSTGVQASVSFAALLVVIAFCANWFVETPLLFQGSKSALFVILGLSTGFLESRHLLKSN